MKIDLCECEWISIDKQIERAQHGLHNKKRENKKQIEWKIKRDMYGMRCK